MPSAEVPHNPDESELGLIETYNPVNLAGLKIAADKLCDKLTTDDLYMHPKQIALHIAEFYSKFGITPDSTINMTIATDYAKDVLPAAHFILPEKLEVKGNAKGFARQETEDVPGQQAGKCIPMIHFAGIVKMNAAPATTEFPQHYTTVDRLIPFSAITGMQILELKEPPDTN